MKRRTILVYLLLLAVTLCLIAFAMSKFGLLDSQRPVNIHGTITRDGKPLEWKSSDPKQRQFIVNFIPEPREPDSLSFVGLTDAGTGNYEIHGIPPGKYKVQIAQNDPDHRYDLLGMVYDPSSTPLLYEVTHDGQAIDIDLPKVLPKRATAPPRMPGGGAGAPRGPGGRTNPATKAGGDKPKEDD